MIDPDKFPNILDYVSKHDGVDPVVSAYKDVRYKMITDCHGNDEAIKDLKRRRRNGELVLYSAKLDKELQEYMAAVYAYQLAKM